MALLKVPTSVTDPIAKAGTLYGQECIMISPRLVKEVTRKILCGNKAIMTLKKEHQYLKCE